MSSDPPKSKKPLAQLRAEKERHVLDVADACYVVEDITEALAKFHEREADTDDVHYHDYLNALLVKADRAAELTYYCPKACAFADNLHLKAKLHIDLGQQAVATLRQADEFLIAADREGGERVRWRDHAEIWWEIVCHEGFLCLQLQQLEAAKRCFLRVMAWPGVSSLERMKAIQGMANYHKERKEWDKTAEFCEKAIPLFEGLERAKTTTQTESRIYLLLADAAEVEGDLERALTNDEKAKKVWFDTGATDINLELVACSRREAVQLLASGRAVEAVHLLQDYTMTAYAGRFKHSGINFMALNGLTPMMAALKVLLKAMVQTGLPGLLPYIMRIKADVEETEAIVAGYWEGISEGTRWELEERRRVAAGDDAAPATTTKSKAAKRKQQKRKAQRQEGSRNGGSISGGRGRRTYARRSWDLKPGASFGGGAEGGRAKDRAK